MFSQSSDVDFTTKTVNMIYRASHTIQTKIYENEIQNSLVNIVLTTERKTTKVSGKNLYNTL